VTKQCLLFVLILCIATVSAIGAENPPGDKSNVVAAQPASDTSATMPATETPLAAESQAEAAPAKPEARPAVIYMQMRNMAEIGKKYDYLNPNNWGIPFNSNGNTILGDDYGIRSTLAKAKMSLYWDTTTLFVADIRNTNWVAPGDQNPNAEAYSGQAPNFVQNTFAQLTYNPTTTTQIIFGATQNFNNWIGVNGKQGSTINALYINQLFMNKKLRVTLGFMPGEFVYEGIYTGGNLATGSLGIKAIVPFEVGASCCTTTRPAVNVRYTASNKWYSMSAIQQAENPAGTDEQKRRNPAGLRLNEAHSGAKLMGIEEFGVNRKAGPGQKEVWFRIDGFFNPSANNDEGNLPYFLAHHKFAAVKSGAMSIAIDKQITVTDKLLPYRGLYVNSVFQWASPEANPYQSYEQVAAYIKGPFKSRPMDAVFINAYRLQFSRSILNTLSVLHGHEFVYDDTASVSGTYGYWVKPGVILSGNLSWVHHPQYGPKLPDAVLAFLGLKLWF